MKYIFAIVLLFPVCVSAQDCKLHRETDPYTKEIKISTGFIDLGGGSVTIDADAMEIDVFFSLKGSDKCFDNNSVAAIFFEGTKVKMTTRNGGSMNCEGFFHFIFKNTPATNYQLQKLSTQKLASVVFTGNNKKETKIIFTPKQQQTLLSLTDCVVNEAKKLIKQ
jgi:hypothetical protein